MQEFMIANTLASLPDQRDIPYVPLFTPDQLPTNLDLMPNVYEVEQQGSIGSCVANGVCSQCESLKKADGHPIDLSRMFLYTATLAFEGRLGQEGLYVRDAYKVAYKYGICLEDGPEGYPYDTTKSKVAPPEQIYIHASQRTVTRYEAVVVPGSMNYAYETNDRVNRIKSALAEGLFVGFAMEVTDSIYGMIGPWQTQNYQGNGKGNSVGGHYMVIVGYDDTAQRFLVLNSWGNKWGDGGFGGFHYSMVNEPFFEAWVIREFAGSRIPEIPGVRLEGINKYRIDVRLIPEQDEVWSQTNIWMGAKAPNGQLFLRREIPIGEVWTFNTKFDGSMDKWIPFDGVNIPPTVKDYTLIESNYIQVVQWMDLTAAAGAEIFLAYGNSPIDWKLFKV